LLVEFVDQQFSDLTSNTMELKLLKGNGVLKTIFHHLKLQQSVANASTAIIFMRTERIPTILNCPSKIDIKSASPKSVCGLNLRSNSLRPKTSNNLE
jgi:hypothetical protein